MRMYYPHRRIHELVKKRRRSRACVCELIVPMPTVREHIPSRRNGMLAVARIKNDRRVKKVATTTCYLCGKPLIPPINADHPVMQQLFAPEIRRTHNLAKLITLDVHRACNTAYKADEDYFVRSLMPFARGSVAGNAIYAKVLGDFRAGKQVPLTKMVLNEFDEKPSGIILSGGKVIKRFRGQRIRRIAWKMVRGLHLLHTGVVLPEHWETVSVQLYPGDTPPPEDVRAFINFAPSRGTYPGVFDYKFDKFNLPGGRELHYWLLLLWDRTIVRVHFHDPTCICETCTPARRAG